MHDATLTTNWTGALPEDGAPASRLLKSRAASALPWAEFPFDRHALETVLRMEPAAFDLFYAFKFIEARAAWLLEHGVFAYPGEEVRDAVLAARIPLTELYRRLLMMLLEDPASRDEDLVAVADRAEALFVEALELLAIGGARTETLARRPMSFWLKSRTPRASVEVPLRVHYRRDIGETQYWPTHEERRMRRRACMRCYCWIERSENRSAWSDAECATLAWNGVPFKTVLPIRRSRRAIKTNKDGCTAVQERFYDEHGWPEERVRVWQYTVTLVGDKYVLTFTTYLAGGAAQVPEAIVTERRTFGDYAEATIRWNGHEERARVVVSHLTEEERAEVQTAMRGSAVTRITYPSSMHCGDAEGAEKTAVVAPARRKRAKPEVACTETPPQPVRFELSEACDVLRDTKTGREQRITQPGIRAALRVFREHALGRENAKNVVVLKTHLARAREACGLKPVGDNFEIQHHFRVKQKGKLITSPVFALVIRRIGHHGAWWLDLAGAR